MEKLNLQEMAGEVAAVVQMLPMRGIRTSRVLAQHGLFSAPGIGRRNEPRKPEHLSNLFLALALGDPSDAVANVEVYAGLQLSEVIRSTLDAEGRESRSRRGFTSAPDGPVVVGSLTVRATLGETLAGHILSVANNSDAAFDVAELELRVGDIPQAYIRVAAPDASYEVHFIPTETGNGRRVVPMYRSVHLLPAAFIGLADVWRRSNPPEEPTLFHHASGGTENGAATALPGATAAPSLDQSEASTPSTGSASPDGNGAARQAQSRTGFPASINGEQHGNQPPRRRRRN